MNNPFTIGFGKKPLEYISRLKDCELIKDDFMNNEQSSQVYIISGVRGSGKTVLLSYLSKQFEEQEDWIVVDLNSDKDLLEGLASELYENKKIKQIFLKKEFSFSFKGITFTLEGDTPALTSETLIKKMLDKIKMKNKKVLITIDEIESNKYMKIFAKTFQSLIRNEYPVYLLMTGLYENISSLQNEKTLTFLYRAKKVYLGPLDLKTIAYSYRNALSINEELSIKLAKLSKGYAFAYQVIGNLFFENQYKDINEKFLIEYDQYLKEFVYDKIWSQLSNKEKEILSSFDFSKEVEIKIILNKLNLTSSYFSNYRDKLIKKGILSSPSNGILIYDLPRFNEFVINKYL